MQQYLDNILSFPVSELFKLLMFVKFYKEMTNDPRAQASGSLSECFLIDVIIIRVWEEQDSFSIDVLQ